MEEVEAVMVVLNKAASTVVEKNGMEKAVQNKRKVKWIADVETRRV